MKTLESHPSFLIRPALVSDVDTILELAVETVLCSRSNLRPEVLDSAIQGARRRNLSGLEQIIDMPEGGLFVAVDRSNVLIGHIIVLANNIDSVSELPQAWVYDVSVRPEWRGRGVGRSLMERAEAFASSLGLTWIGLGVTAANSQAVDFYKELGYGIERFQMVKKLERRA